MYMKKIWVHKTNSFKKAEEFENELYMQASAQERLSDIQFCREQYFKLKGLSYAGRKRLRRIIKVIQ
jgi:hypothetical protein